MDRYDQGYRSQACGFYHFPGTTIPLIDNLGFEAYLAPVNPIGYGMEPDIESTLRALEHTKKAVISIKLLSLVKIDRKR